MNEKDIAPLEISTVVRTVVLAIALINQVISSLGFIALEVDEQAIYSFISLLFTGIASLWAWWKNNSFTKAARAADAYGRHFKSN